MYLSKSGSFICFHILKRFFSGACRTNGCACPLNFPPPGSPSNRWASCRRCCSFWAFQYVMMFPPTLKNIGGSSPSRKGAPAVAAVRPGSRRAAGAVPCPCWHMCGKGRQGTRPGGRIESALRTFHLMEYRKILWQRGEGPKKKKGPPGEAPSRWRRGGLVPQR